MKTVAHQSAPLREPETPLVDAPAAVRTEEGISRRSMFAVSPLNKAMGLYLPATAAFRLINFGRILLLTWYMYQQQFGLLNMILLVVNVMTPLCSLGLNEAVTRYVPQHETRGSLRVFLWRSFALVGTVTAASVVLLCLFSNSLGEFFYAQVFTDRVERVLFSHDAPRLAQVSAAVTGLLIIYFYLLAVLKGLRMFTAVAMMELIHGIIFLLLSIGAIVLGRRSALTMTGLYGISLIFPIIYFGSGLAVFVERRKEQHGRTDDARWVVKLLQFSVWTTLAGITWQVLVYYPVWFLNKVNGHSAVAVFTAYRQIGQFVLIGAVAVVTVVMTTVTKTWESRGREAAQRQLSLAFRGTGLGLLVFCAAAALLKNLIALMFKAEYSAGAAVLPLHLLFFLIGAYLAFLPVHFHLTEKTRHLFWPWAAGVAANMLYAFWLAGPELATVKRLPVWGAAAPYFSAVFASGFSDPQGLDSAAWCGVLAIATALVLCVALIHAECCRLDRGTYIIIAAALLLGTKPLILAIGVVVVLFLALRTESIFSRNERLRVTGYVLEALGHIPTARFWISRRRRKI